MSNFRARSVKVDHFAMIPRADIPRSKFQIETAHKSTFDAGYLVPIYVDEILPGDTFSLSMTAFCRMATPIFPVLDNMYMDTFFFFVPNRLTWDNWEKFMGSQDNPADSISYVIPQVTAGTTGTPVGSIFDYFGLPTVGQPTAGENWTFNALPLRAYNLIYNEWFRDENLQNSTTVLTTNGPDPLANYTLLRRGKRHDYFTSCLPWVQKGVTSVPFLTGSATVKTNPTNLLSGAGNVIKFLNTGGGSTGANITASFNSGDLGFSALAAGAQAGGVYPTNLYADLSTATTSTINQLRLSFQIQKLLERDARGGTRYTEIIRSHFGVISPDARLQRPEYLGGGSTPINVTSIAQTTGTGITGSTTPLATLAAFATATAHGNGFSQSFTEHGYVIGLASVRADLTYQQGIRKLWNRSTRYDFYFPVFAALGEQAVLNKEIYFQNVAAADNSVFGYQERWAEYRFHPSRISGLFRSTSAGTIDGWHLAQRFTSLPTLNTTFIQDTPPLSRVLAVGAAANGQQFIFDSIFKISAARAMPMYSVPGLVDHF